MVDLLTLVIMPVAFILLLYGQGKNPIKVYQEEQKSKERRSNLCSFYSEMSILNNNLPASKKINKERKETEYSFSKRIFLHSVEWKAIRREVFNRYGKTCLKCGSNTKIEIDHITAMYIRPDLRLNINNLQPLCGACNAFKGTDYGDYRESPYLVNRTDSERGKN